MMTRQTTYVPTDSKETQQLDESIQEFKQIVDHWNEKTRAQFQQDIDVMWCFHEFAMEGIVLGELEIRSALDPRIISDNTLIAHYDDVVSFHKGMHFARTEASKKRLNIGMTYIKNLHELITPPAEVKLLAYRKEMPLHRQYAHDFVLPEKIPYRMRKLGEWLQSAEFRKLPPVTRAASIHNRVMAIFPWPRNSGTLARLLMNIVLMHAGYPPAIIPHQERQTYYENILMDINQDNETHMTSMIIDTISLFINSVIKRYGK